MAGHSDHVISTTTAVILAILGLAVIAVIVSGGAQTGKVTTAGGNSLAQIICTALSPVVHGNCGLIESVTSTITFGGIPQL
ncbi:MAG TPA: hypothetical protein VIX37_14825 [Candidatus Sulfotelmatobacter sp.]